MSHAMARPSVATLDTTPLHRCIGARVEGLDLSRPLAADLVAAITAAMDRHAVLVFPGQHFEDDQQLQFGSQFGEVEECRPWSIRAAGA